MASLTGQTIASTYDALLKITDNGPITASLKQITDGLGNNTPLYLSATTVFVDGNFRAGGAFYDGNNSAGTAGQFLVSTGTGVDWQNISESNLISGTGTNGFISKFTASGVIADSVIQESGSNIGIGISPTQKLHVSGNGLFTGTITASNVSGSNTGDESKASIESKLGAATSSNDGYLTAANWTTFNAKQNQLNGTGFVKANGTTISYDNSVYALESRAINTSAPLSGGGDLSANRTLSIAKSDAVTDGYLAADDFANFNSKVPASRTITINGETYDLSANRTYSVNVGVTSFNTRTGAVVLSSGDVTTALGYTPALESRIMTINGVGYSLAADRSWSVGTVTSVGTSAPLTGGTITGAGTIGITQSGASTDGYLSSTDWNTFNNKQAALGFTPENSANKGIANGYASLDGAGKVPSTQLPSYVDDVVEVANFAALPATGEAGKIYITLDTNFVYRWSGSIYVEISQPNAVWGSITGTLSNQTDLQSALNAKVDNTRTLTINGVTSDLSANRTFNVGTVTSVSGTGSVSGLSLSGSVTGSGSLTLGGTLSLTSSDVTTGLGYTPVTDARTLSINGTAYDLTANRSWNVGTVTSVGLELGTTGTDANISNSPITSSGNITLNLPTASASNRGLLSSTDWSTFNAKQNALTLTTTGNSGSATLVGSTLNIPTYTLAGLGGQPLLTNPVTGTGTSGYLTRFTGTTTVGNSIIFDNGSQIGIGTTSPSSILEVAGSAPAITINRTSGTSTATVNFNAGSNFGSIIGNSATGEQRYSIGPSAGWGGFHTFYTDTTERMRITSAGNVGIGTSSPSVKLQVIGDIATSTRLVADTINGYTGGGTPITIQTGGAQDVVIGTNATERMRITSGGNVGIGTTTFIYSPRVAVNSIGQNSIAIQTTDAVQGSVGTVFYLGTAATTGNTYGVIRALNTGGTDAANISINPGGGNVGIGTTSPTTGLVVNSRIQVTGNTAPSSGTGLELFYDGTGAGTLAFARGTGYIPNFMDGSQLQFFTNSTERMRITSGGQVLFGTTSAFSANNTVSIATGSQGAIAIRDTNGNGVFQLFQRSDGTGVGSITHNGTNASFNTSSDYRLKQDLKDYSGLSLVNNIKTYDYQWKFDQSRSYGVLAHELQEVIPYAVTGEKDGEQMQGVDYSKLVPILVKAIQELTEKVNQLENR